ncbi:receptor-like kinase TMK4 [Phalaenopsis equestris]|nr:receptor-like kinase TMK4 [Phalaenopsis equestris]
MTSRKVLDDTVPIEDANLVAAFRRIHPKDLSSLAKFVDSSLFTDEESRESIADVAEIAYHCTAREPNNRPEMGNVVAMLSPVADQWSPSNYSDHDDGSESNISLRSMVHKWRVSDESSYIDSFGTYKASTSTFN